MKQVLAPDKAVCAIFLEQEYCKHLGVCLLIEGSKKVLSFSALEGAVL